MAARRSWVTLPDEDEQCQSLSAFAPEREGNALSPSQHLFSSTLNLGLELLEVGASTVDTSEWPRTSDEETSIMAREGGNWPISDTDTPRVTGESYCGSDTDLRTERSSVCTTEDWGFGLYDLRTSDLMEDTVRTNTLEPGRSVSSGYGRNTGREAPRVPTPQSATSGRDPWTEITMISNAYRSIKTELTWTSWTIS